MKGTGERETEVLGRKKLGARWFRELGMAMECNPASRGGRVRTDGAEPLSWISSAVWS
jgi:hypothetical protein